MSSVDPSTPSSSSSSSRRLDAAPTSPLAHSTLPIAFQFRGSPPPFPPDDGDPSDDPDAWLHDLLDGRLDPESQARAQGRLQTDPEASQRLRDYRRLTHLLAQLPRPSPPLDPAFAAGLVERLLREQAESPSCSEEPMVAGRVGWFDPRATPRVVVWASAAILLVASGLAIQLIALNSQSPSPPSLLRSDDPVVWESPRHTPTPPIVAATRPTASTSLTLGDNGSSVAAQAADAKPSHPAEAAAADPPQPPPPAPTSSGTSAAATMLADLLARPVEGVEIVGCPPLRTLVDQVEGVLRDCPLRFARHGLIRLVEGEDRAGGEAVAVFAVRVDRYDRDRLVDLLRQRFDGQVGTLASESAETLARLETTPADRVESLVTIPAAGLRRDRPTVDLGLPPLAAESDPHHHPVIRERVAGPPRGFPDDPLADRVVDPMTLSSANPRDMDAEGNRSIDESVSIPPPPAERFRNLTDEQAPQTLLIWLVLQTDPVQPESDPRAAKSSSSSFSSGAAVPSPPSP
ncbi:hypothetical protein Isop_2853 [Isosphaera pallida ATCC 43644]|uniref:Uncharacterized protein n=1 Tax=Isosphaera pallida (strain ATCC 43644 / DSM 9630 / IS1B) TaxID=575540 RepID=E8R1K1_ISOPI|nr:hypothetical protein [Isosphaera pallida]ADV63419.1 hypothetical protein Isop_2853 [Isosphaera pallida ATCC 43644]